MDVLYRLFIDENKVQKFEQSKEDSDNAIVFPLLREFTDSQKGLVLLNTGEGHLLSKELEYRYFIFKNGRYSFSPYANEIRGKLVKKFNSTANKVFINRVIDEISPELLPDFIALSSQFLKTLETNVGAGCICEALSKVKNFWTLEHFFGKEGEQFVRKENYRLALKQAALNSPFFILSIFSQSKLYRLENFGFTKEEIKNSMLECLKLINNGQPIDGGWAWTYFFVMLGHIGPKWKVMLGEKESFSIDDLPSEIVDFNKRLNLPRDPSIAPQKSDDGAEEEMMDALCGGYIKRIIDEKLNAKDRLLDLLFHALNLQDASIDSRARFCRKDCPYYGDSVVLGVEYISVKGFYRCLSKYKYFSLEKLIEYFYNSYISRLQIDGLLFKVKMSRSKNWVERLRNNFQEEEIIFKTCDSWYRTHLRPNCTQKMFLSAEESTFRNYLLNERTDDVARMYPNEALRNFYIHSVDVHRQPDTKYEKDYIKLLHFIIFEMEKLNSIINKLNYTGLL